MIQLLQMVSKEPEDLGITLGTKKEAAWTKILNSAILEQEHNERAIIINHSIIELAKGIIAEEKSKHK